MNYYQQVPRRAKKLKNYEIKEKQRFYVICELADKNSSVNWFCSEPERSLEEIKAQKENMQKAHPDKILRIALVKTTSIGTMRFLE